MTRKSLRTKRIFSIILSLAVALTMMPMSALAADGSSSVGNAVAEGGAAQIGDTVYSTLPDAVNAAQDGDTIKLLADYKTAEGTGEEEESGLTITKSVTLDLNGYEMDDFRVAQVDEETNEVLTSGNLTVEDTSAAKTGKVTGMIELVDGKLTINGGAIGNDRNGVWIENGNLIVNGGTIDFLYGSNSGTVTITGGTVKNAQCAAVFEITVTGGSGHTGLWDVSEGTWNISGGEFGDVTFLTASPAKNLHITGGTFGKITRQILKIGGNGEKVPAPISGLLADGYAFYAQAAGSKEYDQYVKLTDAITSQENVQVKGHTHNFVNGVCAVCGAQVVAQDNAGKYYLNLAEAFAGVADGGTVTMLKSLENDKIRFCRDAEEKSVDKTVTLMMNGQSLSFEGASPLYVESGKLIIGDEATISQPETVPVPAVWVDNHDQDKDRGTLEFQGKATLTGGLLIQNWGKLVGGLKEGTIITSNGTCSVSVERSETYSNVLGLLGDGLAFAKKDKPTELVNGNVKQLTEDVIVVAHTHSIEEGQSACACGRQFEASVTAEDGVSYYDTIDSAFAAAHEGGTVKLLADITNRGGRGIFVSGGPYTLDLNGHRIEAGIDLMVDDMDGSGVLLRGELTVKDSSTNNAGYVQTLKLWNGDLTVESGSFRWIVESGSNSVGTITITGGTADEVKHTSAGVTFRLSGGTFKYVENIVSGKPGDLLADNRAFFNRDNNFVNGYDDRYQAVSDVVVKEHMHNIVGGSCECGFTCAHDWSKKNGVCTVCGYHCPHNADAAEADGVWACNTCGQTVTAMLTAPDGATTYYADGYVDNNVKSGLYFAIKAAKTGSTVAALGGEYSGGYVKGGKTLTLDVSNGKTIDGMLNVGYTNTGDTGDTGNTGNKLIVRGSAEISYVIVEPGNTLDLTGWTGRIVSLTVQNGGKATLNGGTFATLYINGATAGSLLAEGYAFQNVGTGAYVEYSSTADMENVKVVKCLHPDAKDGKCLYCGQTGILARVGDTTYDDVSKAVKGWLANGGTLTLYADGGSYDEVDFSSARAVSFVIDLNGHKFNSNGRAIKTGRKSLTITDSKEKTGSQGAFGPIIADSGRLTLESGHLQGLTVSSDSSATILLKGGKLTDISCPVPIFNLLPNGYALMSGDNPVDPAKSLFGRGVYTIKNSQTQFIDAQKNGEAAIDSNTIPFALSLKTADSEIGQMGFTWYIVEEDGTTQKLAATTSDVTSGADGVYTCNAANMTVDPNGWTGLEANKTYNVLCVVNGKTSDGTSKWQTPMRGYQLTVNKATPTGTPKYTAITKEGQTLADANLTAEGENKESLFKALGKAIRGIVKWVESEDKTTELDSDTKVEQGKTYTWLFTPTDHNYKELTGAIVLWAKPASGGGGGVVTPAPTPADADVITVKEDTKDNTTSKPGAETGTTTTKTTVKNTTTETTKNEQGQDVSKTTASVSKDLGDKLLDQAVSNKSDTIEITVKSNETNNNGSGAGASAADSVKATEVELPKATVNAIAKDTNADLVIKTDNGEVVLDNKTLETIAGAAKGDTVTIVVGENTQLKETQKPAEKIVGKNGTLFDLAAKIGERLLHQFEGGKAHVTLPMPEKLKGKDVLVIYIDDNGLCKILNHSVEKIGAEDYIRFTTTHFSTFAVVDKDEAERLIKEQNAAYVKELMQSAKFKVTTTKTSKKSVKVQVAAKSSKTMLSDIKSLGYTVKYQFYRSTKKTAGYKLLKTKTTSSFTNTKGTKGTKYYYKARVLVYDGKTLIAKSELKQASCGVRTWTK